MSFLINLSANKTHKVAGFLQERSNVKVHFTPTYFIWLKRAGGDRTWRIYFRGRSRPQKLILCIRAYSKTARPFQRKYSDAPPHHGMLTDSVRHTLVAAACLRRIPRSRE